MKEVNISTEFIKQLKQQIVASRYAVAKIANAESLRLYYTIGKIIDKRFEQEKWGAKVLDAISAQLQQELPGLRGFSGSNLRKMRLFFNFWKHEVSFSPSLTDKSENHTQINSLEILPSLTDKLTKEEKFNKINNFLSISFTHHYEIIIRLKSNTDAWYYINKTATEFWSVRHLRTELKNKSHLQESSLPNNFSKTMPDALSNKAIKVFKDQYLLDFVNVEDADEEEIDERVLENEIVLNIKKFLMSLGSDFTFMGNQYRLIVDNDEYFIDLLFFHRGLQSLVAFELKKGRFKPEYVGKMNFYLSALDDLVKQPHENPSIGIILCKEKDNKKVEYSFRDFSKPMGVSVFKTSEQLPEKFKNALPDAETLKKLLD